ncbi:hypothetical protein PLICRDRAFT_47108 [Plicaturopsis crispa FD-325 SS-3]|uniref:Uncharacterized protein n=1 Tax=Plicaturopsis crispa FD-325 SS-3 TaxID=944288 RepID=A0A0C9SKF2_PLICR|nr:hypothetical protein PLICRDRAFT_47108 [Plicaturopsis crispa FD-325 SS-3]
MSVDICYRGYRMFSSSAIDFTALDGSVHAQAEWCLLCLTLCILTWSVGPLTSRPDVPKRARIDYAARAYFGFKLAR